MHALLSLAWTPHVLGCMYSGLRTQANENSRRRASCSALVVFNYACHSAQSVLCIYAREEHSRKQTPTGSCASSDLTNRVLGIQAVLIISDPHPAMRLACGARQDPALPVAPHAKYSARSSFSACEESYYPRQLQWICILVYGFIYAVVWFAHKEIWLLRASLASSCTNASAPCMLLQFLLKTWHAMHCMYTASKLTIAR